MLSNTTNKKLKQKKDAFIKTIEQNRDKRWVVCSHDNPDPDSIASCLGMQHILNCFGVEKTSIVYCGEISHPQNRAMYNILDVQMVKWNKWCESNEDNDNNVFVFVDCMPGNKNMSISKDPIIVIDHHKVLSTQNYKNALVIREEIGSCATIIASMAVVLSDNTEANSNMQCLNAEDDMVRDVSTALAIGIKTDTLDFRSEATSEDDFRIYKMLCGMFNEDKFNKIVNYQFPPYVFDYEQIAWQNKKPEFQPNLITGLGFIKESQSDCIPTIADKFMRLEGVQTVVVYGITSNSVRGSIRTSSSSLDTQTLCNEIFGEGNAGVKQGVGGARVPFSLFDVSEMNEQDKNKLWELTKSQIEQRFDKAINK